jgi:aminoglycoside 6'-N-acetyltransferase
VRFAFERLSSADLPSLRAWLVQPHVAQWLGDPDEWLDEITANLGAEWVWHFRADLAGIPTGFVQCYDTSRAPRGSWSTQPRGTLGVGYFLGRPEVLGQGYGTQLLREFVATVTARWRPRRLVADPDLRNERSVRAARSCGFLLDGEAGLFVKEVHGLAPPDPRQGTDGAGSQRSPCSGREDEGRRSLAAGSSRLTAGSDPVRWAP